MADSAGHAFTFRYSKDLIRRYYFGELWRSQAAYLLAIPVLLVITLWARANIWFSGIFLGLITAYLLMVLSSYRAFTRELGAMVVTASVSESGLHFDVDSVTSTAPWTQVKTIRFTPHALVCQLRSRSRPVLVPRAALTPDVAAFIVSHVEAAGGRRID